MKKLFIVIVNIILIILILFIAEYITRGIYLKNFNPAILKETFGENKDITAENSFFLVDGQEILTFRKPLKKIFQSNDSIILAGCSFTFGHLLDYNDTFSSVLYNYSHRNVYNLGMNGASPREFLYILRHKNVLDRVVNTESNEKIKYVIYTYIEDQRHRLYSDFYRKSPCFKKDHNDRLYYYEQNPFFVRSLLYIKLSDYIATKWIPIDTQYKLLNTYFKEINNELKKLYGEDIQFIVFVYLDDGNNWDELKKEGIKIIFLDDIVSINPHSPEYLVEDGIHPNKKAWETIVPELSKKLNL